MWHELIEQGHPFKVDFHKRYIRVGKKVLMDNGEFFDQVDVESSDKPLELLQQLYNEYYYSTPSERSGYFRKLYFKASDEVSLGQMVLGGNREAKRFQLEVYMLYLIMNYKWEDLFNSKHFFYKGENGMIVLREWWNADNSKCA